MTQRHRKIIQRGRDGLRKVDNAILVILKYTAEYASLTFRHMSSVMYFYLTENYLYCSPVTVN